MVLTIARSTSRPCAEFDITWILNYRILDNINFIPPEFGIMGSFYSEVIEAKVYYDIRLCDFFSIYLWFQLYQLWPKNFEDVKVTKQQKSRSNNHKNIGKNTKNICIDWLWHSCLYGHKENLKKILEEFFDVIKINEIQVNGNTALHLGILGNHLPIVQTLLSKCGKELKLSIRNNDGFNPLDLAILKKNNAIIKLLYKHAKPEISSLACAVETDQPELVEMFRDKLNKPLERQCDLLVPLQRFVDLSKEINSRNTSEERKNECKVM